MSITSGGLGGLSSRGVHSAISQRSQGGFQSSFGGFAPGPFDQFFSQFAPGDRTGFRPEINPELGGSSARKVQQAAISALGSAGLTDLARGVKQTRNIDVSRVLGQLTTVAERQAFLDAFGPVISAKDRTGLERAIAEQKAKEAAAQPADLSGFKPGLNPELGPGFTTDELGQFDNLGRLSQQEMIASLFGSPHEGALSKLGRGVRDAAAGLLGISLEPGLDPASGNFGVKGSLNPISLVGGFETFSSTVGTLSAIATGAVPLTAGLAALGQTLQGPSALTALGNLLNVSIPLGFTPSLPAHITRAIVERGNRVGRANLTEVERLAFDAARRDMERAARTSTPSPTSRMSISTVQRTGVPPGSRAASSAAGQAIVTRGFRLARGADSQGDLDLLRTRDQAAQAAGLAPRKPTVLSTGARPGPIL